MSDTNTENGTYLVGQADPNGLSMRWYFTFSVGYSPSQLSLLRCEMKQHVSRTDTPNWTFFIEQPGSYFPVMATGRWTTSDQWVTYEATTPATYMDSNNQVTIMICSCPTSGNSNNYTMSWDVIRLIVTTVAPVANFTATPTVGAVPLTVDFADTPPAIRPPGPGASEIRPRPPRRTLAIPTTARATMTCR